jgi:RNA polymerase sigma-70 factor (ECF subfamily)
MELNKALLILLKKGNEEAFEAIFKQYAPRLYYFILGFSRNKAEAEEIVQDTFVKVWENRSKIDENKNFNTFLMTIAKRIFYNVLKHRIIENKYILALSSSPLHATTEDELERKHLKDHVNLAIAYLSPQQKEILLLRNKGYDNKEIAEYLNISKRTVETHITKAFRLLRSHLKGK